MFQIDITVSPPIMHNWAKSRFNEILKILPLCADAEPDGIKNAGISVQVSTFQTAITPSPPALISKLLWDRFFE